jgi:ribosomal protein S8
MLFYRNIPFFNSVRLVSTLTRKYIVKYKALKIIKQSIGTSTLVLSTDKGLITHREALKLRKGGILLYVIS